MKPAAERQDQHRATKDLQQKNLLKTNKHSTMAIILLTLTTSIFHLLTAAPTSQTLSTANTCTCGYNEKFGGCSPEKVWREHYDHEVGLYGDCLPQVPENTVRCFRYRLADGCGDDQDTLKCNLRHRGDKDDTISTTAQGSSAVIFSPGFNRKRPGYSNKNFCVYNISLDCPSNTVELEPSLRTTSLSDADTCQDYLSFHVDSQRIPVMKLCGQDVADKTKYRDIHSNTFYGVLWSNDNDMERGRFEITAKCKNILTPAGSGDDQLILTDQ